MALDVTTMNGWPRMSAAIDACNTANADVTTAQTAADAANKSADAANQTLADAKARQATADAEMTAAMRALDDELANAVAAEAPAEVADDIRAIEQSMTFTKKTA